MLAGIDVGFLQWDLESTGKQWRDFSLTNNTYMLPLS
jgi:hypothetical protein